MRMVSALCPWSLEGGLLPYIACIGACCWAGYGFWPRCREQGISILHECALNRV